MTNRRSKADRGLFRRRGSPHWWIRFADENGRIRRESTGTKEKGLAREILAKNKTLVVEGRYLDKKRIPKTTFFELCTQYWELEGQHKRTKGLSQIIDLWKEGIGNVPTAELSQQKIERYLNDRMVERGLSAATRNRHVAMMSSMFNKGVEWGLVVENPTRGIKSLRENGARVRFLDQEEIRRLIKAASEDFRPILMTALHSGMRRGEILNLKWADVDLKNRIITVQDSKSGKKRTIPVDDTLYETLGVLSSRFQKGYVFLSPRTGERWVDFKKQFHAALQKAGVEDFRFHDSRHTFASHLVMAGVDIKTVQELLGHATLTMTMKYTHLAPDHRARAIRILDSAYQTDTKTDTVKKDNSGGSL